MPLTPERIGRLREFGLSEYAARSYLALLDLGVTEARDISALSKVPASKIYHVLEQLHDKGLVTILPEFPRKYAPVPFGDYLRRLHEEHEAEAAAIRRDLDRLAATFAVVGETAGGDRGTASLARGRRNVLHHLFDVCAGAQQDLLLLLPSGLAAEPRAWGAALDAAQAHGIRPRVMAASPPSAGADWRRGPDLLGPGGLLALADGRRALVAHLLPDDGHLTDGSDTALVVDQEGLGPMLAALAEVHWSNAAPGHAVRTVGIDEAGAHTRSVP